MNKSKIINDSEDYKGTDDELKDFLSTHHIVEKNCEFHAFNGYRTDRYIVESVNDKTKYELRVNYNPMDETFTLITGPNKIEINYNI
jgi:hypothetical protein